MSDCAWFEPQRDAAMSVCSRFDVFDNQRRLFIVVDVEARLPGSVGSAIRLSGVLPYHAVTLSLEIERQNVSAGSDTLIQRSMRANRPSTRGR